MSSDDMQNNEHTLPGEASISANASVPQYYNFAAEVVDKFAREQPEKTAIVWVDDEGREEIISFSKLSVESQRLASALQMQGLKRGDTVIILMGRQLEWWYTMTACLRMGLVASPGTTQLSEKDIAYRVEATAAACLIADASQTDKLSSMKEQCNPLKHIVIVGDAQGGMLAYQEMVNNASADFPAVKTESDEDALCYFTSGTTGYPKMCIHNHIYARAHNSTGQHWLDLSDNDLHWNLSDTGWAKAAWSSYFAPWLRGAAIFVHHTSGFSAEQSLAMFARYGITTFCAAPTVYRMFVQYDLSDTNFGKLRHCVGAGEPLNAEVIDVWNRATGITIRDGYGQTESVILCGNTPNMQPKPGSMGKPIPGIDLAVIDQEGNRLAVGEEGDIAVCVKPIAPLGLFKEYKGLPEKTAACFRGDWYITGDRATVDEDGYFWFVSRADDVILSSGYRIGPFEVESALLEHAAVIESAVTSSPDAERGEVVKAFIVLAEGVSPDEELKLNLQNHVKTVTAPYKYPRKIEFVDQLPKTVSGKIRRVELRDKEWANAS
ncbi:AMP-binding protein [uncultured Pseudoteredinibacter sp.]|uniref:AMP-binding protein n=1 Tax=uncultured Pseudoteredinibacter sp. TaxID=1641701 RepID=UPI002639FB25|nr:AMP-binding protein [uncultured Pseudoteredinibacter sp.]